jgi:hypothetical protein
MPQQRPGGKEPTSFRISPEAKELLRLLSDRLHIPQSAVLELAIREKARREKVGLEGSGE